jgi:hypothetical protein
MSEELETIKIIDRYPNNDEFFEILSKKELGRKEDFDFRCKTLKGMVLHSIDSLFLPIAVEAWEKFDVEYKIENIDEYSNKVKVTVFYYNPLFEEYYHLQHYPFYVLEIYGAMDDILDDVLITSEVKAIDYLNDIWIRYEIFTAIDLSKLFERGTILDE